MEINVLVACEESQRVATAFRERGFNAFSCDIQECSGGHPEYHVKGDVLLLLNGNTCFKTQSGDIETILGRWDLIIAHPPCTYLSNAGIGWYNIELYGEKALTRYKLREEGAAFFMQFINADCEHIAVENPVGYMSNNYRKPDQIIQPYYFATDVKDSENYHIKTTCLWLKNLPCLKYALPLLNKPAPCSITAHGKKRYYTDGISRSESNRAKERSKTFSGIAAAMAKQWGDYLINEC